jgi:general secretion pathway protein G
MLLNQPQNTQTARTPLVRRAAFTLMEMMVVVAIIIILIGISAPLVINYWNNSKIDATRAKIQAIQNAAQTYQMNNGTWPASVQDLTVQDPQGRQPVLRPADVLDAWGQPIVIDASQNDGARPLIYSNGPPNGKRIDNSN